MTCPERICVIFHMNWNCLCQFTLVRNEAVKSPSPIPTAHCCNPATPAFAFTLSVEATACCFCHSPALAQRRDGDLCNWLWQWFYIAGAFFLYAGFAALGLVFIYGCLPETKGKKLEEIESLFENRLCTCGMSDSDEGRYIEYIRVKGSNYHLSDNDASDVE